MVKISSGLLKGLQLKSPTASSTRPSGERLRQALYNVLRNFRWQDSGSILDDAVFVDIFSGTGAVGIEALSNGASHCVFLENGASVLKTLYTNIQLVQSALDAQNLEKNVEIVKLDVLRGYAQLPQTRIVFADPPYHQNYFEKVVALEAKWNKIEVGGLFIFEAAEKEIIPSEEAKQANLHLFDEKQYGESKVYFFVKR